MRKKKNYRQQRFDLDCDNPDEKALRDYLVELAQSGKARQWIVQVLLNSMPNRWTPSLPPEKPAYPVKPLPSKFVHVRKPINEAVADGEIVEEQYIDATEEA